MTNKDIWRIIAKTIAFILWSYALGVYASAPALEFTELYDVFGLLAVTYSWMSSLYYLFKEFDSE